MSLADSAGTPWAGRHFEQNDFGGDDGSADPRLIEALRRFGGGDLGEADVVDAVRTARLLVPLIAQLGEAGTNDHGQLVDKTQELAIVTVAGPDGRSVLPAFTSVDTMRAWNPLARPVPVAGTRVALAAAGEQTDLVVLDPTSPTEFVIRRPALWAIAQDLPWTPSYLDPDVERAVTDATAGEIEVLDLSVAAGDPRSRLAGPELVVRLTLDAGLDATRLSALTGRIQSRLSASELVSSRVDSLRIQLVATRDTSS